MGERRKERHGFLKGEGCPRESEMVSLKEKQRKEERKRDPGEERKTEVEGNVAWTMTLTTFTTLCKTDKREVR